MGSAPSELSIVSVTSARPSGGRDEVPAKITSSILPPRRDLALCSPMTHASASTTLDLPEPLGPTTQVMPGSNFRLVAEAKDLKPRRVKLLRYKPDAPSLVVGTDYLHGGAPNAQTPFGAGASNGVPDHVLSNDLAVDHRETMMS